ncbi:phosphatidylinositol dephosphorylation [Rhizoctonia solani]|uniref:Phosphatidylinositol dephosphorylation n=1 Tax=Rhizoctonia solani TaxID=456999 RepID=A0A8H7II98_9AGAM|nr:phosphatidylinositol dephosphorylation [Rhizoctonia solani]
MPNASPRRNGLANLRPSSIVSSPGRNSSVMLKKDTESDASNDIDEAPTPTQIRASPPPISRKPDSVVSSKGLTPIGRWGLDQPSQCYQHSLFQILGYFSNSTITISHTSRGYPSLAPTSTNGQTPPILPIRINIPDTSQVEPFHNDSEVGDTLRSPVKRLGPPRAQVLFTPSTPGSPAPLPSRTSPDMVGLHLFQWGDLLLLRPRHPPIVSSLPCIGYQSPTGITNSLVDAPPPLPNRRSNPNLRSEVIPIVPSPVSTASAAPPPPMATRPTSSTWGRLAGLKAWPQAKFTIMGPFKPPPPPTRTIAPGDKLPPPRRVSGDDSSDSEDDVTTGPLSSNPAARKLQDDMPDSSQSRRCPPIYRSFTPIHVPSHGAVVAAAGYRICIAHTSIEIYDAQRMPSPQFIIDLEYIGLSGDQKNHGSPLWNSALAKLAKKMVDTFGAVERCQAVIHVLRYGNSMLTMDESGKIIVFEPSEDRLAPALSRFTRSHRAAEKQTFAKILGGHFEPVGPALCGAIIPESPDRVYIGHEGGCISIWKYDILTSQHTCVQMVKLSASSVITIEGVGSRLWLGTRSGTITVCEVREDSPWMVTNQWQAHGDSPVAHIAVDPYSISKVGKLVVYSVGRDDRMLFWDGLVGDNWIDDEMQKREEEYSTYRDVKVLICTWNIDSAKPDLLTGNRDNTSFLDNVLGSVDRPDIIVFGFQEVIDLENKKLTAKTVLLGSQKSKTEKISEKVSRSYKLWYDRLVLAVRLAMPPDDPYTVIHSENLVGLFTCIFVRNSERISLTDTAITTIKRGMKGRYGNKGAIIARFTLDDTSFCFLNCHLAAGQKHVRERNQDLAAMFEEKTVFPYASPNVSATAYVGGGDGTMVLDHEVVFLNGDLNYRIDQRRELVIQSIHAGDINSLLPNDQLLKEMQYNPGFRLRHFTEPPITFAPTYKYDRGSNEFDSSEKRRIPAWCDRILYRSRGDRVQYEHYKRYEPNVSDHRPVSGGFRVKVKSVNRDAWNDVKARVEEEWQGRQDQLLWASQEFYTGNMSKLLL